MVGFSPVHQELLRAQLSSRFDLGVGCDSLANITKFSDASSVIVVLQQGFGNHTKDEVIALRTQSYVWNPVVILESKSSRADDSVEWSIWHHGFPPNIEELISLIGSAFPLSQDRRNEVVSSGILQMHSDLSFLRAGNYNSGNDDAAIRNEICELGLLIAQDGTVLELSDVRVLVERLQSAMELPIIDQRTLADLRTSVVRTETIAREYNASAGLRSRLHQFSNSLRYAEWACSTCSERTSRLVDAADIIPRDIAELVMPGAKAILDNLKCLIKPLKDNCNDKGALEFLSQSSCMLAALDAAVVRVRPDVCCADESAVKQIVIVEDDMRWQAQIRSVLNEIACGIDVVATDNYTSATHILESCPEGTLALVDLGLPASKVAGKDNTIDLDAGLKLMRQYERSGHGKVRFIVLTAAQNYACAVRECLSMGVQPADYIQKDPQTWEQQLRSRVQIALAQKKHSLPIVDVFRCTARLVRVDGVEVILERKPYVVLEYLATRPRAWSSVTQMRSDLTQPGDHDITPPMSKEQLVQLDQGARITPFDILTPKHIHDYVYDLRKRVAKAFADSGLRLDTPDIVSYNADLDAYRLQASSRVFDDLTDLVPTSMPKRVLVVEDHPDWKNNVASQLASLSFETKTTSTLRQFEKTIAEWVPEIVTLDLQIPLDERELAEHKAHEHNGIKVMRILRDMYPEVRIVVLTSIAWNDSIMLGMLRDGVTIDDYLDKKWDNAIDRLIQSVWRLSVEIQHSSRIPANHNVETVTNVTLRPDDERIVLISGHTVTLGESPARVFRMLAESPNTPVDRDRIVDAIWDSDDLSDTFEDSLNTTISRLRKEITRQTDGVVDGRQLIRSADGVYWLHGVVVGGRDS